VHLILIVTFKNIYTQIQDIFKVFETKNIIPTAELLKKEFIELNKSNSSDQKKLSKMI
jgi:hypothetical protein